MGTVKSIYESREAAKMTPRLSNDPAAFKHFDRGGLASDSFLSMRDDWLTAGLFVLFLALGVLGWMAAYWLG